MYVRCICDDDSASHFRYLELTDDFKIIGIFEHFRKHTLTDVHIVGTIKIESAWDIQIGDVIPNDALLTAVILEGADNAT